jgi:glycosyltransferase involved in cell wall biosynthesis
VHVVAGSPLKIGIDARAAADEPAGGGRYVRELLRSLARLDSPHRFFLYTRRRWQAEALDERFAWRVVSAPGPLWHLTTAASANRNCDVFLATTSYLTSWALRIPAVVVVFDMVAFDCSLRPQRRAGLIERMTLRTAALRAAAIAAISGATRDELSARYPSAATKVSVTPLGADAAFSPDGQGDDHVLARHAIVKPYLLSTGTLEPRKNLPRLIEAFNALPAETAGGHRLVLVGPRGWDPGETLTAASGLGDRVRTLGHVSDDDLPAIYRQAELFCYPSLQEGFGLPLLEAMQCGTAVVASDRPGLLEVGGDAVRYVDPLSVKELRTAIQELLEQPQRRAELSERGRSRAKRFSWRRTAEGTLELLERAAG